ncbi:hypothetical protein U1Q18_009400, partial [Sarracenia purpurea var. burkii]
MECNKDEAIRAREIAEKKMENDDFEGAWKIAQKAHTPSLVLLSFSLLHAVGTLLILMELCC